jgi:O-antigen biosynthesis protein
MTSPRRVSVVAHELRGVLPVGGMGTATTFLALALARMGHDVEILLGIHDPKSIDPYWKSVYETAGVRIQPAPVCDTPVEPWQFLHMRSIELGLRIDPPDVVVAADFGAPAYTALRLRQAGVAFEHTLFVGFCHGTRRYAMDLAPKLAPKDLRQVLAFGVLEQAAIELADAVVSPSAYLLGWMRDQGWQLPEYTRVIPYFTRSAATGETVTKRPRSDHDEPLRRLVFFGRLDERKGLIPFAAGLNELEPELLAGVELEFLGKTTATWTQERVDALFSERTKRALRGISFATDLDQHDALARLSEPGTLAVMPSLQENSPNTVYECLESGIPFIASDVGGVRELIGPADRARVLFEPTAAGVEGALRRVLSEGHIPQPARAAHPADASDEGWAEVIATRPPSERVAVEGRVDVVVRRNGSQEALARCLAALDRQSYADFQVTVVDVGSSVEAARQSGLRAGSAPYVLFLDEDDVADEELLKTLLHALRASGADTVTCGAYVDTGDGARTLHLFTGEPRGLGALSNAYGNVALSRREVLGNMTTPWPGEDDPDWPLFARVASAEARIVSIPIPLVTRKVSPGSVERTPGDALLAVQEFERVLPEAARSLVRLGAGLAASAPQATTGRPSLRARVRRRLSRGTH